MKKILVLLFVVTVSVKATYADDWGWPTEKDYFSENEKFVAHVTPPKYLEKDRPLLEVFEIKGTQRVPLFQFKMDYMRAPLEVYVSDEGKYVVTVNEHGSVGHGNHVVAFYGETGLIKNYSMEEILHLPKDMNSVELARLIPHSTTSRWWDRNSIKFFAMSDGKLYFCIWLHLFNRWIAWNPDNGEEVKVDNEVVNKWNEKGRLWSFKEIEKKYHSDAPYEFLGKLKNPDDRCIIEELLTDEKFSQVSSSSRTIQPLSEPRYHLERYYFSSARRSLAERILANWDGKPTKKRGSITQPYYYLGKVEGIIKLPKTNDSIKATLWIYLVSTTIPKNKWHIPPPVQRLVVSFDDYSFTNYDLEHTQKFPFGIASVTPSEYFVKAVLDKTEPFSKHLDRIYLPQRGDYQSVKSPIITVNAGETIENVIIDCTHKVTNGTD